MQHAVFRISVLPRKATVPRVAKHTLPNLSTLSLHRDSAWRRSPQLQLLPRDPPLWSRGSFPVLVQTQAQLCLHLHPFLQFQLSMRNPPQSQL